MLVLSIFFLVISFFKYASPLDLKRRRILGRSEAPSGNRRPLSGYHPVGVPPGRDTRRNEAGHHGGCAERRVGP